MAAKRKPKFRVGELITFQGYKCADDDIISGVFWNSHLQEWLYSLAGHPDFRLLERMISPRERGGRKS